MIKHSVVVDTNLIFSALIPRASAIRDILLEKNMKFYAPDNLCHDVDIADIPFVALAIELQFPLWTGDKRLKEGLRKKGFNHFYNP